MPIDFVDVATHWIEGNTGNVRPTMDNGGDLSRNFFFNHRNDNGRGEIF
jgi:hypothetical protein